MFDAEKETFQIPGWLSKNESSFLFDAARKVSQELSIVEIGSWKGKSTICLAKGAAAGSGAHVFAVDPHTGSKEHQKTNTNIDTFPEFLENIQNAQVAHLVTPIRNTSKEVARNFSEKIGLLFIDGAHDYHSVKQDFHLWFSRVADQGVIAFHDSWHFPGPNLLTAFLLLFSSQIKNPKLIDTITSFQKTSKNSIFERVQNLAFLFLRTFLFGFPGFLRLKRQSRNF